jgi:hypothetical protein
MMRRVLDDIVKQSADDGRGVESQLGEGLRDFDAVRDEWLAVLPDLPGVGALAEAIGAGEHVRVQTLHQLRADVPAGDDFAGGGGGGHASM